ncbi:hypothetical protein GCM10009834_07230 [Streptomonospora arabica]
MSGASERGASAVPCSARGPARTGLAPTGVAATPISTPRGIRHDVGTREEFRARTTTATDLHCAR